MSLQPRKAKDFLIEDLENKKSYQARFDGNCSTCMNKIYKSDEFYFIGDSKKLCLTCKIDLIDLIEERL